MKIVQGTRLFFRLCFLSIALFSLAGCNAGDETRPQAHKTFGDYFDIKLGDKTVRLQFAVLPLEQQQGLMFRRDLGENDGMIFVYEHPQAMSFWMRNTPTALDIGYFDSSGTLLEVYPMHSFDETPVRSRSDRVRYAVEMKQNWYREHGVRAGAKLDLAAVAAALKARGLDERRFSRLQD